MMNKVMDIYSKSSIKIKSVNLWTDSQIALFWIMDHPSKWNVFVANRAATIQ